MEQHKDNIKVALNLNEELTKTANILLEKHAAEHSQSKFEIICDLPQLCRDLCVIILRFLWQNRCKGYKTKTAEICSIHRHTVDNYEKFIDP